MNDRHSRSIARSGVPIVANTRNQSKVRASNHLIGSIGGQILTAFARSDSIDTFIHTDRAPSLPMKVSCPSDMHR